MGQLRQRAMVVLVLCVTAGLASLLVARADDAAKTPPSVEPADRIAALEARIQQLETLVHELVAESHTLKPGESPALTLPEAVRIFNLEAQSDSVGKDQPPLTVDEVIAAIRWFNREEAPVTDDEFAEFRKIADTQRFPAGTRFEVINTFIPGDGYRYTRWSVRILMPRTAKPGWTFAYSIRERSLRAEPVGANEATGKITLP